MMPESSSSVDQAVQHPITAQELRTKNTRAFINALIAVFFAGEAVSVYFAFKIGGPTRGISALVGAIVFACCMTPEILRNNNCFGRPSGPTLFSDSDTLNTALLEENAVAGSESTGAPDVEEGLSLKHDLDRVSPSATA